MPETQAARQAAVDIVRVLRGAGHVAYLAGGCVRDELLGLPPKDYDVATDAAPQAVCRLLRACRKVGEAFGVVLVRRQGVWIEVATFRQDVNYVDGRRPQTVTFTDARHDALRRDFTINGLFSDPLAKGRRGRIIDYVGGVADLRRRRVRAIGDPRQRLTEDYLRMLRAARFAARLDFQVDRRTAAAIRENAGRLEAISRERIGQEVAWMLQGRAPVRAARLIQSLGLDEPVLREPHQQARLAVVSATAALQAGRPGELGGAAEAWKLTEPGPHKAAKPAACPDEAKRYATLLTAWLLDRHWGSGWAQGRKGSDRADAYGVDDFVSQAVAIIERWRAALCLTNQQSHTMRTLIRLLARATAWERMPTAARKRLLAEADWPVAWTLLRAMVKALGRGVAVQAMPWRLLARAIRRDTGRLVAQGVAPRPLIDGHDLLALGYKPGPALGRVLHRVYDAQLEGLVRTKAQAMRWVERTGTAP